ncbi:hypothetical protein CcrColossus_gp257 [Caulobacter phage CcrColossus]|uniref:Uncharacterized protein n=1 Tax=Caulobacter phage CcrColossus TaxID=1211640 RepID=K4K6F3_9CAUD|nr:hypothetical protein CcrColossus_gp257 [Caulobacter phage CcrColossus]AFU88127.1 hypothetical protein CcrColossus_gp257 [Caulobacter phage CcrColossus]
MAELRPTSWTFSTSNDEMVLILKALGGRLTPKEAEKAKALGDQLTRQRARQLEITISQLREAVGDA